MQNKDLYFQCASIGTKRGAFLSQRSENTSVKDFVQLTIETILRKINISQLIQEVEVYWQTEGWLTLIILTDRSVFLKLSY